MSEQYSSTEEFNLWLILLFLLCCGCCGPGQGDALLPVCAHEGRGRSERLCWGSFINVCIDVKGKQSREPELHKSVLGFTSHFRGLF